MCLCFSVSVSFPLILLVVVSALSIYVVIYTRCVYWHLLLVLEYSICWTISSPISHNCGFIYTFIFYQIQHDLNYISRSYSIFFTYIVWSVSMASLSFAGFISLFFFLLFVSRFSIIIVILTCIPLNYR